MKALYSFEIMNLDDGMVAVPVGDSSKKFNGVLKVNETAAVILKLLEENITEEEIIGALLKEYEGDVTQIANYVHEYLKTLKEEGIVE